MELNEYQAKAYTTITPESDNIMYMVLGLTEEVGEVSGSIAKALRRGELQITENDIKFSMSEILSNREQLIKEVGDVLWFVAGIATKMGVTLEDIAYSNLLKLKDRQERGVIVGEGNNR